MKTSITYFVSTFLLSLLLVLGSEYAHAQMADSSGTSNGLPGATRAQRIDTRSVSLAGASMADPYSISSMNINPALISFVRNPVGIEYHIYQNWSNNIFQQNLTLPAIRIENHTAVLQMNYSTSGDPFLNSPYGEPSLPEPNIMLYDIAVGYSFSIDNLVSVGILNNFTYANDDEVEYLTYFADFGFIYKPADHLTYGLVFRGLGSSIIYQLDDNNRTNLNTHNLRERLEIGTTLQFPAESDHPWMTLSFSNEKLFGRRGIWYKGGLELKPNPYLAFRSGLIFVPIDRFVAPRYGIGINTDYLRLDYSISPKQVLSERFHQFSLTLQF